LTEREEKSAEIFESAVNTDPIVREMRDRLHKYNSRSKILQLSAKALYSAVGICAMTPTLAAPIAEISMLSFMTVTGGPEQDKLLKEIYLTKCLESRYRLIAEKTNLISACHTRAIVSKNPALLACTTELLRQMTSDSIVDAVLSKPGSAAYRQSLSTLDEGRLSVSAR
jgi:hypothetical protein